MIVKNLLQLQGQNYHMATFGEQGDISNICQFGSYEWVYARDGSEPFPHMDEVLGRFLGPAKNKGNTMMEWVLKINGRFFPRKYLRQLRPDELTSDVEIKKRAAFDAQIKISHGDSFKVPEKEYTPNPQYPWDE